MADLAREAASTKNSVMRLWNEHSKFVAKEPVRVVGGSAAMLAGVGVGAYLSRHHPEKNIAGAPLGASIGTGLVLAGVLAMVVGGDATKQIAPALPYAVHLGTGMIGDYVSNHVRTSPSFAKADGGIPQGVAGY